MTDCTRIGPLLGWDWGQTALRLIARTDGAHGLQILKFASDFSNDIPALYLPSQTGAVVLYCHAHGNRYDIGKSELTDGRPALLRPYLADIVARGWGVLCLDMPCFGGRQDMPEGPTAKAHLWRGRVLFGQMLAEQNAAADWLTQQSDVYPSRIAVMGISMGGTLAWWLAAMRPGMAAAVSMCCFADLGQLIATGAHDGHGHYMTVPGLLTQARTGQISGLAAPTPLLHCVGFGDWSTPPHAFEVAQTDVTTAYDRAGVPCNVRFHIEETAGHTETTRMRAAVLGFLQSHLTGGVIRS